MIATLAGWRIVPVAEVVVEEEAAAVAVAAVEAEAVREGTILETVNRRNNEQGNETIRVGMLEKTATKEGGTAITTTVTTTAAETTIMQANEPRDHHPLPKPRS